MLLLDCMYVICCSLYQKSEKDTFKVSGGLLLAAVLMLNFLLVSILYGDTLPSDQQSAFYNGLKAVFVFCLPVVLLVLYYRYAKRHPYEELLFALQRKGLRTQNLLYCSALAYLLLSVISIFGYAIYSGGQINGWW